MKDALNIKLAAVLALGLASAGRGQAEGSFSVDGLMVDSSSGETPAPSASPFETPDLRRAPPPPPEPMLRSMPGPPVTPHETPLTGNMPPSGRALERLQAAELYAGGKEWARALEAIQEGIQLAPRNILLLRRGGAIAALAGNYMLADDYYRMLMALQPNNMEFINARVAVLLRMRRFMDAQPLADQAVRMASKDPWGRLNHACLRLAMGVEPAQPEYWQTLSLNQIQQMASWLNADRSEYESFLLPGGYTRLCALVLGDRAADRIADLFPVFQRYAKANASKEWDGALSLLEEMKGLGLAGLGPQMEQARLLVEKGEKARAMEIMAALAQTYSDQIDVLYNYAYTLILDGQYDRALPVLDRTVQLFPEAFQAVLARACVLGELGRVSEAWPILEGLMKTRGAETRAAFQDDAPYMRALRTDPRFRALMMTRTRASTNAPVRAGHSGGF